MNSSILPPQSTSTERALETAGLRLDAMPVEIATLWNPETCPAALLPWLAFAFSVDEWDADWSESTKRAYIAASISIHRHKGTVKAMRDALQAAGLGDATLIERFGNKFYGDHIARNGTTDRQRPDHWAEYRVILHRRISLKQAELARRILKAAAPVRCHLKVLDFRQALTLYGDRLPRDGTFSRGAA